MCMIVILLKKEFIDLTLTQLQRPNKFLFIRNRYHTILRKLRPLHNPIKQGILKPIQQPYRITSITINTITKKEILNNLAISYIELLFNTWLIKIFIINM